MLPHFDISGVFGQQVQCDLRLMCGPKYNTLPDTDRRESPGKFFLRDACKLMLRVVDEESERWDGLE